MKTKLLPQAPELEEAVLGALLLETEAWAEVSDLLIASDFYLPQHQAIYKAMSQLATKGSPIDMLTVTEELRRMDKLEACGGAFYISQLTARVAGAAHIVYHARVVKEKAHARRLIHMAAQLVDKAFDETVDIYEAQETFEAEFTALLAKTAETIAWDMPQTLKAAVDHFAAVEQKKLNGEDTAISTGLAKLDKHLSGGWQSPDLIILGARPGMGKTQFALHFAKAAAASGNHVLFASLEMKEVQLVERLLLEDHRIDPTHLRTGKMETPEWEAVDEMVARLWNLPIYLAGGHPIRHLHNIRSEARRLKRKGLLDFLIVDYVGQVRTNKVFKNRYQEVGYITGELKNLAKELDIPVLLLSQLTRPLKGLKDRRPVKEDLRESGDIEQDADIVLMIHKRGEDDPDAVDSKGNSLKNRGEIIIEKYRHGAHSITIPFRHDDRYKNIR